MLVLWSLWFLLFCSRNCLSGGSLVQGRCWYPFRRVWAPRNKCFLRVNGGQQPLLYFHIFGLSPLSGNGMRCFSQKSVCHLLYITGGENSALDWRWSGEQALEWLQIWVWSYSVMMSSEPSPCRVGLHHCPVCVCTNSPQLRLTFCDPIYCSLLGFSVHGIL